VHGLVGTVNQNLLPDELYAGPQGWKVSFPLEPPLKPAVLVKVAIEITPNLRADPSIGILRGDKCRVMACHEIELQGSTAFEQFQGVVKADRHLHYDWLAIKGPNRFLKEGRV
jgi:hypothetical protein